MLRPAALYMYAMEFRINHWNFGSIIYEIRTYEKHIPEAKRALKTASSKLPGYTSITVSPIDQ